MFDDLFIEKYTNLLMKFLILKMLGRFEMYLDTSLTKRTADSEQAKMVKNSPEIFKNHTN